MKKKAESGLERKLRRIKAACVMLERQAQSVALVVSVPFGERYEVPCARHPDGSDKPGFPHHLARAVIEGWQVLYSIVKHSDGSEQRNGSAMLWPHGRSSVVEDWDTLRELVTATSGEHADLCHEQVASQIREETTHPNRPHHWCWFVNVPEQKLHLVQKSKAL